MLLSLSIAAAIAHAPGQIGAAAPSLLTASDPEARWVALCQVPGPVGEIRFQEDHHQLLVAPPFELALHPANHAPYALQRAVVFAPSGAYGVVVRDRRLALYTADSERMDVLDGVVLPAAHGAPPAASFDPSSRHLVYLRGHRPEVVLRTLETGAERLVETGAERLSHASFATDTWLVAWLVDDTDGDGRITDFGIQTSVPVGPCVTGGMTSSTSGSYGDVPRPRLISMETGAFYDDPVAFAGKTAAYRREAGDVAVVSGASSPWPVPAGCRVLGVAPDDAQVVAACGPDPHQRVRLISAAGERDLGIDIEATAPASQRVLELVAFQDADGLDRLVDASTGRSLSRRPWSRVLHRHGSLVVQVEGTGVAARDLETGSIVWQLVGEVVDANDRFVAIGQGRKVLVADIETGKPLGRVDGPGHAVSRAGDVLVAVGRRTWHIRHIPAGPFRWVPPR